MAFNFSKRMALSGLGELTTFDIFYS